MSTLPGVPDDTSVLLASVTNPATVVVALPTPGASSPRRDTMYDRVSELSVYRVVVLAQRNGNALVCTRGMDDHVPVGAVVPDAESWYAVVAVEMPTPLAPGCPGAPSVPERAQENELLVLPLVSERVLRVHMYGRSFVGATGTPCHPDAGGVTPSADVLYALVMLLTPTPALPGAPSSP